jgi:hypothetical protein
MSTLADLRPGDLLFGPIGGFIPGVFPVGAGQLLFAERKELRSWRQWWKYRHVAVVVEASHATGRGDHTFGPMIVQAMPSGAEEIEIGPEHWMDEFVYVRPAYAVDPSWDRFGTGDTQANAVARHATNYIGTPYSFLDYGAIAALHAHIPAPHLRAYVSSSKHMICSQLADQAMSDAGFHVFDDGRLPQDVVPAELYRALIAMPGTLVLHPGDDDWYPESLGSSLLN